MDLPTRSDTLRCVLKSHYASVLFHVVPPKVTLTISQQRTVGASQALLKWCVMWCLIGSVEVFLRGALGPDKLRSSLSDTTTVRQCRCNLSCALLGCTRNASASLSHERKPVPRTHHIK